MKKILLIILDGAGDRPIGRFGGKTPLEAANKPNMDRLAAEGVCGTMYVIGKGIVPESDNAHLTLFGYDLSKFYPGRGPIEAMGIGARLEHGDIALRANLATIDKNWIIKDRRAGRIKTTAPFCKLVSGMEIDGVKFLVFPGLEHRAVILIRGNNLSDKISNSDPHEEGMRVLTVQATDGSKEAKITAGALNKFLIKSHEIFNDSKLNKERLKQELLPGNFFLTRGAGHYTEIPSFMDMYLRKAACIAGGPLYKGLGAAAGMDIIDVKGATGTPDTDLREKFAAAADALKKYDFVFLHIKGTDVFGHDGKPEEKKKFIEKIDQFIPLIADADAVIAITSDHCTPCEAKDHADDPVPFLIHAKGMTPDSVKVYGESYCRKGRLGLINGKDFMKNVLKFAE